MNQVIEKIKQLSIPIIENNQLILYDIEEDVANKIIRIIVDDPNTFDIDIDKVATINSEVLDVINDYLPDDGFLEVTSVGIERELKNKDDLAKAIGKYIYVSCYTKLDNHIGKEIYGYLLSFDEESITVDAVIKTRKKIINIKLENIAKKRLAVKF